MKLVCFLRGWLLFLLSLLLEKLEELPIAVVPVMVFLSTRSGSSRLKF